MLPLRSPGLEIKLAAGRAILPWSQGDAIRKIEEVET